MPTTWSCCSTVMAWAHLSTGFWRGHMAWRTWSHGNPWHILHSMLCMLCMPWMRQTLTQALTQAPQPWPNELCMSYCCTTQGLPRLLLNTSDFIRQKSADWAALRSRCLEKMWPVGNGPCQQLVLTGSDPSWIKSTYRKTMENYDHAISGPKTLMQKSIPERTNWCTTHWVAVQTWIFHECN